MSLAHAHFEMPRVWRYGTRSEGAFTVLAAVFTVGGVVILLTTIAFFRRSAMAMDPLDREQGKGLLVPEAEPSSTDYGSLQADLTQQTSDGDNL
mmetsp:Transcript_16467/g.31778  ORF Transcript_16467/g.31778 Transcript_16467/m.31778 type:complete len:94 (+) Transcript_16467:873-1154(+)|eukprot:CAMPEP_0114283508 /NCGR_PEP_ID=MMETSP0059-20121206/4142_1 /TAXON_ID=36894 /ORGANISM="Pyramimonas parkeae, Strain CCMP726" /LENGTH=93 /DNA_ID=CAMNT_0001404247 /DNA_START=1878 /DNA_END=2159 /DNA_ORIENTATION=+